MEGKVAAYTHGLHVSWESFSRSSCQVAALRCQECGIKVMMQKDLELRILRIGFGWKRQKPNGLVGWCHFSVFVRAVSVKGAVKGGQTCQESLCIQWVTSI